MTESRKIYQWTDFPQVDLFENTRKRSAFRSDGAMVVFNWTKIHMPRLPGDSHPFDQTVVTFKGRQMLEVGGHTMELSPGTIMRIPADARHNSWPIGDEPTMHLDIYAPARPDYDFLVNIRPAFRRWSRARPRPRSKPRRIRCPSYTASPTCRRRACVTA